MGTRVADSHDRIEVRGARANNLADVSVDLPKRRLTVFTGMSHSGFADPDKKLRDYTDQGWADFLHKPATKIKYGGITVIVIEHHQAVMAHADWIIDLGPGAGHDGGQVVFEGTPAALVPQATH
jgi:excinuclease UvrABC ATPase subunit